MRRYWRFVVPAAAVVVLLGVLLFNLNSNLVYFNTPTELLEQPPATATDRLRLGGQVESGSVVTNGSEVEFNVTDGRFAVSVLHEGAPPELFTEGSGVVVEGTWDGSTFHSDTMIIKHDEQYRTEEGQEYETGRGIAP